MSALPVRAQSCHSSIPSSAASGLELSAAFESAHFDTTRYVGHYEGLTWGARWSSPHVVLAARVPQYRIVRNGAPTTGLGDALFDAVLRVQRERVAFGPALTLMLPTGNSQRDLGMGHAMVMPGVFATADIGVLLVSARAAYGAMLSASGNAAHHHHSGDGSFPLVMPMNASELQGALELSAPLRASVRAQLAADGAVPVPGTTGAARLEGVFGVEWSRGRLRAALRGGLPLTGGASRTRFISELAIVL